MVKIKWKKAMAAAVAAAMTMLAVPTAAFADEVDAQPEEVVVYEADEVEDLAEEAVEVEEVVGDNTDETADAAVVVEPVEEEKVGAGNEPTDPNDPQNIKFGDSYSGQMDYEEVHYYKFDLKKPARVYFNLSSTSGVALNIVDKHNGADYSGIGCDFLWALDSYSTKGKNEYEFSLTAPHTYYMEIFHHGDNADYSFSMSIKEPPVPKGGESIIDPDLKGSRDDAENAVKIATDKKYVSMFPVMRTAAEWYKFQVSKDNTPLYLTFNSPEIDRISFALYYDGVGVMNQVNLKQYDTAYKGNGYSNTRLVTTIAPWHNPMSYETDVFPEGTYYLWIRRLSGVYDSGYYNLSIGTKAGAPVKSVAIDKKKIALGKGGSEKLTAIVKPDNADEKAVIWNVKNPLVAKVDDEGNVTGISEGKTEVTATSSVNNQLIATCDVYVADVVVDNVPVEAPNNAVKEKVDVTALQYFGREYDKYEVSDTKLGSVDKKGFFTSKKPGKVEVRGLVKAPGSNLYVCAKTCVVEVKQPTVKYEKDAKEKEIKFFTAQYVDQIFDAAAVVDAQGVDITGWQISDKKETNFELLKDSEGKYTGQIKCKKNGTNCKVTPLFGAEKTPGNVTFTLKTVTPKLSAVKKLKQQTGTNFVIKLSNCTESDEIDWKFVVAPGDDRVADKSDDVTFEEVNASKPSKLQKKVNINKAVNGKIVATVNGHDYECEVSVLTPEIKAAAINTKVGKAVTVGVKNTKIKSINWVSSATDKVEATDAAKGKFKAVAAGTSTISAEIGGVMVSCEVTVTE